MNRARKGSGRNLKEENKLMMSKNFRKMEARLEKARSEELKILEPTWMLLTSHLG